LTNQQQFGLGKTIEKISYDKLQVKAKVWIPKEVSFPDEPV